MPRYQIQVQVNGVYQYLDTSDYESISLTYNIADIANISNRNSSYSKTITLPETSHNRAVFGFISDLASDSSFNPNLKSPCIILVDTIPVFDGYLQLKSVFVDTKFSEIPETKFECVVYADNDTFFTRVGESYLEDLEWDDLNHVYGTTSIIDSWYNDWELGYYYPFIDYGEGFVINDINGGGTNGNFVTSSATQSFVEVKEMFPATYIKKAWDKIFNSVGFSYQSEFLNSDTFKNLIIPYSGVAFNNGPTFSDDKIFRIGSATPSLQVVTASQNIFSDFYIGIDKFRFNNETSPNGDPNGLWNTTDFSYTKLTSGYYAERFGIYLNLEMKGAPYKEVNVRVFRQYNPTTGIEDPLWAVGFGYSVDVISIFAQTAPGMVISSGNGVTTNLYSQSLTDFRRNITSYFYTDWFDSFTVGNPYKVIAQNEGIRFGLEYTTKDSANKYVTIIDGYVFNEVSNEIITNGTVFYKGIIPKKVKQKDFITSIVKMFNLYIEPSKFDNNTLIIETREDYYNNGVQKDWTKKIDLFGGIEEQILAETQKNKQTLFTYKEDKDYLNTYYKDETNEIYGQELYETDNEFAKNVKKIDVIFSPTPLSLIPQSLDFRCSRIIKDLINYNQLPNEKKESNIRILFRYPGGLLPMLNGVDKWAFEGIVYNGFPYAGHFDNPYDPQEDLNWGNLLTAYIPTPNYTENNLVNNYYLQMLEEISDKDSKIITLDIFLTADDLNQFYFSDGIYLFLNGSGHYYKVNKIDGYDPGKTSTCKVQFLKTKDITVQKRLRKLVSKPTSLLQNISSSVINLQSNNVTSGNGNITTGIHNFIYGSDVLAIGSGNSLQPNNGLVIGDDNYVYRNSRYVVVNGASNSVFPGSDKILISGNNNQLQFGAESALISGDNNIIGTVSSNIKIIGSDNTIGTGSNDVYIYGNNNFVTDGVTSSVLIGNNINATESNYTYLQGNVKVVNGCIEFINQPVAMFIAFGLPGPIIGGTYGSTFSEPNGFAAGETFSIYAYAVNSNGYNDIDPFYNETASISLSSGTGNLLGTLSKSMVNGSVVFNDLTFDASGTKQLTLSSGTLLPGVSPNIIIV